MDNSPTSLFESYEQDFKSIIESIRGKLDGEAKDQNGEQRKATLRRVDMEVEEADEIISQMEVEIQGMPQSLKARNQIRVKTNKSDLSKLRTQAKALHATATRADLLGSHAFNTSAAFSEEDSGSQRTRLLAGTQTLTDSTRRLEDSHRIALETEDVGADILRSLRIQREGIVRTRDTLHEADASITRASGTLKGMIRRMNQQRVIMGAIIAVLLILIGFILWSKLSR
ncbi:vesicle transport v-snare protein vti1 [Cantharellus anzutake]|uniref:vesicle transport v-snare protein vti1 n=1 Tax=Cantharellus anzutake TaxID=1750568 RepID=UPI001908869E|nr:vesicle transport v-snare protein vti1 [Cantharellus anzutake]KAF8327613.1 vesicle transport v-snare protein vti1 [Cantharellus anzutake]